MRVRPFSGSGNLSRCDDVSPLRTRDAIDAPTVDMGPTSTCEREMYFMRQRDEPEEERAEEVAR